MRPFKITWPVLIALLLMAACGGGPAATPTPTVAIATATTIPTPIATPTLAPTPEATLAGPFGPSGFPANVNPLTGLTVSDPAVLNRRPLLIKVSNQGPEIRPQSGLSFADHVWEFEMEGWALTRFTAVFYSQTPTYVGSVRSARLPDIEQMMDMYGGILVYSGGSSNRYAPGTPPRVNELINAAPWVRRVVTQDYLTALGVSYNEPYFARLDAPTADIDFYHKLFANPAEIWRLATEEGFNDRPNLDGLYFNFTPPAGGTPTTEVSIDYLGSGPRHIWRYDAARNRWLSFTEDQQAHVPEAPDTDFLTGQQLAFDNVVIIHAFHWDADYIEDEATGEHGVHINLDQDQWGFPATITLLRDGMRFEGTWQRTFGSSGMMQFLDANGQLIAFKPGTIWFSVVNNNLEVPTITFAP